MTTTTDESRLSLSAVRDLQCTANNIIRRLAERIAALATASAELDQATQHAIASRNIDGQQRLVNVGRHLAALVESEGRG